MGREEGRGCCAALVVEVDGYRKIKEWCDRMGWCIM